ncbi:hypothetical protein OROGR_020562 [Orobanche gracilis]
MYCVLVRAFRFVGRGGDGELGNTEMDNVPYASAVGSLMYAMVCTRPDIAHAVGVVSRFLSNSGKKHWEAVKRIFRYLRGTSKLGITFGNGKTMLVGYRFGYGRGSRVMAIKIAKMCCLVNNGGRIYCGSGSG